MNVSDPNTTPEVWPQCSECGAAYVLRRGLSFTKGWIWVWQQDCKHKKAPPVLVNADGPAAPCPTESTKGLFQ